MYIKHNRKHKTNRFFKREQTTTTTKTAVKIRLRAAVRRDVLNGEKQLYHTRQDTHAQLKLAWQLVRLQVA
jgi:hypothetical protein